MLFLFSFAIAAALLAQLSMSPKAMAAEGQKDIALTHRPEASIKFNVKSS